MRSSKKTYFKHLDLVELQKWIKLFTKFENFVSAIITTSNMKKSVLLYNMIKTFVQTIDGIIQMRTYRSVHDVILRSISNFYLPQSVLVNLENLSSLVTNVTDPTCENNFTFYMGNTRFSRQRLLQRARFKMWWKRRTIDWWSATLYSHKTTLQCKWISSCVI